MLNTWSLVLCVAGLVCIAIIANIRKKRFHQLKSQYIKPLANTAAVQNLPEYKAVKRRYRLLTDVLLISFIVTTGAVAVLAARPTKVVMKKPSPKTDDIVFCIDTTMIPKLKEQFENFSETVKRFNGQRVGVTIYDYAYFNLSPLSDDYEALSQLFRDLANKSIYDIRNQSPKLVALNFAGIARGIIGCVENFDKLDEEGRSRYLVLAASDDDNETAITQAKNYARRNNIETHGFDLVDSLALNNAEDVITYQDDPSFATTVAAVCLVIMLLIIWRLGL